MNDIRDTLGRRHRQGGLYTYLDGHVGFTKMDIAADLYDIARTNFTDLDNMFISGYLAYHPTYWPNFW